MEDPNKWINRLDNEKLNFEKSLETLYSAEYIYNFVDQLVEEIEKNKEKKKQESERGLKKSEDPSKERVGEVEFK